MKCQGPLLWDRVPLNFHFHPVNEHDNRNFFELPFSIQFCCPGVLFQGGSLFTADKNRREEIEERGLRYLGHAGELHPVVPVVAAHDAGDEDLQKEERTRFRHDGIHQGAWSLHVRVLNGKVQGEVSCASVERQTIQ